MEILLIVPKYKLTNEKNYDYNVPLGLAYISAAIKNKGYMVDILNLNHLDGKIESIILTRLDSKQYDVVCTGGFAQNYTVIRQIISSVRNHPSCPKTILGGTIITSEPELIFDALNVEIGVIGEGEITILELIEAIDNDEDLSKINGIIYRDVRGETAKTQPREPIANLDTIPFPDVKGIGIEEQIDHMYCNEPWKSAFDYPRVYSILGSRSCPFKCTFCYHDIRYRARSIENITEELRLNIEKYDINFISMYDECFAVNKKRIYDFCREIRNLRKQQSKDIRWMCQLRVSDIDETLLREMKDAGCDVISYGFESYSSVVLKSMKKNITPEQIDRAFKLTINAKINVQANFIFGDVAETKETAKETLDYYEQFGKGQLSMSFIQPYPNSEIYQHCIKRGIIKDKLKFIENLSTDHWYNMTDKMTDDEIMRLKHKILKLTSIHTVYVAPISGKSTSKRVYSFAVKCPFCNQQTIFNNCFVKNIFSYGFQVVCRSCNMRFFVLSQIQRIAYRHYLWTRGARDIQKRLVKKIMKRKV